MICWSKTKICRIILEAFHFYATYFILSFLLRQFFKTVGEIRHLLTLSSKLIFRGALKKAFMVPEEKSYQKQYFAKIFLSLLASTLHIHFYFHLKESSENVLWIVIALKSATFSAPESAPETTLKTMYFILFHKNLTKIWRKSWWSSLFWWNRLILQTFLFSASYILEKTLGKTPQSCMAGEKLCLYSPNIIFSLKHFRLFVFLKNYD